MKKIGVLLTSIIVASSLGTTALADTAGDASVKTAGVTPDSIFYPIDLALDNLRVALAKGNFEKAQLELKIADERLSESIIMSIKSKPSLAIKAAEKYNETINNVQTALQTKLSDDKTAIDDKTAASAEELEAALSTEQDKASEALKDIQNKLPEESKKDISSVIEMQTQKKAAVKAMVEARHSLNAAKHDLQEAVTGLKKAEKTTNTEAITAAKAEISKIQTKYDKAKADFTTAFKDKQDAIKNANTSKKAAVTTTPAAITSTAAEVNATNTTSTAAQMDDDLKEAKSPDNKSKDSVSGKSHKTENYKDKK